MHTIILKQHSCILLDFHLIKWTSMLFFVKFTADWSVSVFQTQPKMATQWPTQHFLALVCFTCSLVFLPLSFFHSQLTFSTVSSLHHSPVLLFLLCCSFSGPHFRPIPSFSRTSGNISRQTDHLGVRPVNVLIVIYSWTEFKMSFSLLTTWSWGPGKKKKFAPSLSP